MALRCSELARYKGFGLAKMIKSTRGKRSFTATLMKSNRDKKILRTDKNELG